MLKEGNITDQVISAYYRVYNSLGYGFLEKVYENALCLELQKVGLKVEKQVEIEVFYEKQKVGKYFADILVEEKIILELKAVESLIIEHEAQLINYLRATSVEVGLLLNFGKKPSFKRKFFENKYKKSVLTRLIS